MKFSNHIFRESSIAFLIFCIETSIGVAKDLRATLYELGSKQPLPLFRYFQTEETEGEFLRLKARFEEISGKIVAEEETKLRGDRLVNYRLVSHEPPELHSIEIREGRVVFRSESGGKTTTNDEEYGENFVIGPTIERTVKKHWQGILRGAEVRIRLAVADRRETIGFKFFRTAEETWGTRSAVRVRMKPTSFFIALFVEPIFFIFDRETGNLLGSEGPTFLKQKREGEWKPLSVQSVFDR